MTVATLCNWRVVCMLPLFFCANVFYSYQQNDVNGMKFNIRISSLNGALYWLAQMFGGLLIRLLLDLSMLERPGRACLSRVLLFIAGKATWGGRTSTTPRGPSRRGLYSSHPTGRAAVLVGTYKAFQAAGSAMAWRINAQQTSAMTQLAMDWGLSIGSLVLALPTVLAVTKSTSVLEEAGAGVPSDKIEEKTVDKL
ncbi:hypothetical protein CSUB01_01554 [Colletotrichum sublineola]|uniref:Uncharacterized protein n=1 Tax=Colletotrichum sublineola TaxID=1173701 RepID=A0A066XAB3_COLSU|nr:hypothetical protein CSUB01_01554 [Colletotrichum sublineola]